MSKERRMLRQIAKTLIQDGCEQCDINQILDNYKAELATCTDEEEIQAIIDKYKLQFNIESSSL